MYEDADDDEDMLFISWTLETKITRVVGNTILPSKLTIRTDVNPIDDIEQADLSAYLSKIRFWFENLVGKSVAFSFDNDAAMSILIDAEGKNRTSNLLMITPGDPSDEALAALFKAKMTALAGGRIDFSLVEVKSDNMMGLSFIYVGSTDATLPTIDQWIGPRSYFSLPWWKRDDASTLDVVPPDDADLSQTPAWAFSLDAFSPKVDVGVVVRPNFKPTVIPGGKPEA